MRALRHPERVLTVLAELTPMGSVGPVELDEVRLVLGRRLLELAEPSSGARYGAVWVGPAEDARGLVFDQVFVPGLAERLFPRKIAEEPILLDATRERLPDCAPGHQRRSRGARAAGAPPGGRCGYADVWCSPTRASIWISRARAFRPSTRSKRCVRRRAGCPATRSWRSVRRR